MLYTQFLNLTELLNPVIFIFIVIITPRNFRPSAQIVVPDLGGRYTLYMFDIYQNYV